MKKLALACALAFVATGCLVVPQPRSSRAAVRSDRAESCPPGHRWSDGQCHSKGKGHDR